MTTDQELLRDFCPKVEWNEFLFLFKFFFVSTNCRVPALERLVRPEIQSFLESSWRIYSSIQRFRGCQKSGDSAFSPVFFWCQVFNKSHNSSSRSRTCHIRCRHNLSAVQHGDSSKERCWRSSQHGGETS